MLFGRMTFLLLGLLPAACAADQLPTLFPIPEMPPAVSGYSLGKWKHFLGSVPKTVAELQALDFSDRALQGGNSPFLLAGAARVAAGDEDVAARAFFLDACRRTIALPNVKLGNAYSLSWSRLSTHFALATPLLLDTELYAPFARRYTHFLLGHALDAEEPRINMDMANHRLPICWQLAAHLPDPVERDSTARKLQRLMNLTLAARWTEQYSGDDLLTPDGGGIHHQTHHLAYVSYSLPTIVNLAVKLDSTPYGLGTEARHRLHTFMHVQAFSATNALEVPGNLRGRCDVAPLKFGSLVRMREQLGIMPVPLLGHWSLNVTAAALHRRDDWLVAVDGCRNDRRGSEIYAGPGTGNNYSRYFPNGSIMILATPDPDTGLITASASGYRRDGWNWSFIPGATSLERPFFELASKRPGYIGHGSPFGGGIWLEADGIWGLNFTGADVHFRKSAFCFGDRITMLTSNITPKVERPAITTLYQQALDGPAPTAVSTDMPMDQPVRLTDARGHGYVVHAGMGVLKQCRGVQRWPYLNNLKEDTPAAIRTLRGKALLTPDQMRQVAAHCNPSEGQFARAWIDHGTGTECAVSVYVNRPAPLTAAYTVLQQDQVAHILHDHSSNTIGYVVFDSSHTLTGDGALLSTSRPCFVMLRRTASGLTKASVGATDMRDLSPIVLNLRGSWRNASTGVVQPQVSPGRRVTTVTLEYRDYMPMHFALREADR